MVSAVVAAPRKMAFSSWLLGGLMVATALLTVAVTPRVKMSDSKPKVDLTAIVPSQFGEWREERNGVASVVNPETEAALAQIYTQTLSRNYVNAAGEHIMLSVAYGDDQRGEATQAHRPEICYTAQGFAISSNDVDALDVAARHIPVRRLVAISGNRVEPITYWVTVGDRATLPGIGRKLTQLVYGLGGEVPDGLLFRVSSIERDKVAAFKRQDQFVRDLFVAIGPQGMERLAGKSDE